MIFPSLLQRLQSCFFIKVIERSKFRCSLAILAASSCIFSISFFSYWAQLSQMTSPYSKIGRIDAVILFYHFNVLYGSHSQSKNGLYFPNFMYFSTYFPISYDIFSQIIRKR